MDEHQIDQPGENTNTKIFVTAIISVLAGTAFILVLILFGMSMQKKYDSIERAKAESNKTTDIISLEYTSKSFSYKPGDDSGNSLLKRLGAGENEYFVISSQESFSDTMGIISEYAGKKTEYSVEDGFFDSGSIILVAAEGKVSGLSVKSVVRDENYDVQIDTAKTEGEETKGQLVLVKIQNIQPTKVTVVSE